LQHLLSLLQQTNDQLVLSLHTNAQTCRIWCCVSEFQRLTEQIGILFVQKSRSYLNNLCKNILESLTRLCRVTCFEVEDQLNAIFIVFQTLGYLFKIVIVLLSCAQLNT
jgi:hypothetical protein